LQYSDKWKEFSKLKQFYDGLDDDLKFAIGHQTTISIDSGDNVTTTNSTDDNLVSAYNVDDYQPNEETRHQGTITETKGTKNKTTMGNFGKLSETISELMDNDLKMNLINIIYLDIIELITIKIY